MAHTSRPGSRRVDEIRFQSEAERDGDKVSNSCGKGLQGRKKQSGSQLAPPERSGGEKSLPYSVRNNGKEVQIEEGLPVIRQEFECNGNSGGTRWPSGPGELQAEWEEPRTIEPGMGCTIDGYNFREDLLRMYGNGVVEQTAELAWRDLWRKQLENINRAAGLRK